MATGSWEVLRDCTPLRDTAMLPHDEHWAPRAAGIMLKGLCSLSTHSAHTCVQGGLLWDGVVELEVPWCSGQWQWYKQDHLRATSTPEPHSWCSSSQSRAQLWGCLAREPPRRSCALLKARVRSATWVPLLMKSTTTPVQVRGC